MNPQDNQQSEIADSDYPSKTYQPIDSSPDSSSSGPSDTPPLQDVDEDSGEIVRWSMHEPASNPRNTIWYVAVVLVAVILIVADVFFIKSYTFSALVLVMVIALFVYDKKPSNEINYTISGKQGLYVGEKLHHFSEFKSFGVVKDDASSSIVFIPVKRFSPSVTIYVNEEVGEKVVDILGQRLPMETIKRDVLDSVIRKLQL